MRPQRLLQTALLIALLPALTFAQQEAGSVSGHIYCADTQQPARVARVELVPLPPPGVDATNTKHNLSQIHATDTRMDGSFSIPHVPAGDYYLSVTYSGYLSPEYIFSEADLRNPTPEIRKRIIETIPTISVAAGKAFTLSATIHRGAAISGIVRYDDGSPVPDMEVEPIVRGPDGHWIVPPKFSSDQRLFSNEGTDDLGHYRIRELPPGEYSLKLFRYTQTETPLAVYYGDSFFEKDAKIIKVGESENGSGNNVTIRLSKLHILSGVLLNVSGQPINAGQIALSTEPDGITIAGATVTFDNPSFHMDLVPEGHYTLRVTEAHDVLDQLIPAKNPGDSPTVKETVLATYGDYESPIEVLGDQPSLVLTIPPATKASPPTGN